MEIYQLRTFLAIAHMGNLTRAAERLNLTQPAVSKQIKSLEEELGVELFERTPTGMVLTKSGQQLLPQAEKTLADAVELIKLAKNMSGAVVGTVRLGTIIDPNFIKLGFILGKLLEYYPNIDVKLTHGISGWALDQVKNGAVDAGFYLGAVTSPGIHAIELCTLNYLVVAPPIWAENIRTAEWSDIVNMPWIGTPQQSSQNRLVSQMFQEHGATLMPVVEADQESTMIELVGKGVGLCLVRDDLALSARDRGELVVWEKTSLQSPLSFIYQENRATDAVLLALGKVVQEVWAMPVPK